jgi:hypothetical protein
VGVAIIFQVTFCFFFYNFIFCLYDIMLDSNLENLFLVAFVAAKKIKVEVDH